MTRDNPLGFWLQESFGIRNPRNIAAWAIAGGVVYYLWVLPEQREAERRKAIVEEWKDKYRNEPSVFPVDRQKHIPDPLNRGLTKD